MTGNNIIILHYVITPEFIKFYRFNGNVSEVFININVNGFSFTYFTSKMFQN